MCSVVAQDQLVAEEVLLIGLSCFNHGHHLMQGSASCGVHVEEHTTKRADESQRKQIWLSLMSNDCGAFILIDFQQHCRASPTFSSMNFHHGRARSQLGGVYLLRSAVRGSCNSIFGYGLLNCSQRNLTQSHCRLEDVGITFSSSINSSQGGGLKLIK